MWKFKIFWNRTTVFKVNEDWYSSSKDSSHVLWTDEQAKEYCIVRSYFNWKLLRTKNRTPDNIIVYWATKEDIWRDDCIKSWLVVWGSWVRDYYYCIYKNNSEVKVMDYVKCWNWDELKDPSLSELDNYFNNSQEYSSIISNRITSYNVCYTKLLRNPLL